MQCGAVQRCSWINHECRERRLIFACMKRNTQQTRQLEQSDSIAWHKARRLSPAVLQERAKQMCPNVYKCTIFTRSPGCPPCWVHKKLPAIWRPRCELRAPCLTQHRKTCTSKGRAASNSRSDEKGTEANHRQVNRSPHLLTVSSGKR